MVEQERINKFGIVSGKKKRGKVGMQAQVVKVGQRGTAKEIDQKGYWVGKIDG